MGLPQRQMFPSSSLSIKDWLRCERAVTTPARHKTKSRYSPVISHTQNHPQSCSVDHKAHTAKWKTQQSSSSLTDSTSTGLQTFLVLASGKGDARKSLCGDSRRKQKSSTCGSEELRHYWVPWGPQTKPIIQYGWGGECPYWGFFFFFLITNCSC